MKAQHDDDQKVIADLLRQLAEAREKLATKDGTKHQQGPADIGIVWEPSAGQRHLCQKGDPPGGLILQIAQSSLAPLRSILPVLRRPPAAGSPMPH